MSKSPIGRSLDEIVQNRAARDSAFASALLEEAVELMLAGELPVARYLIRNVIKGSMGYAELSRRTGTPEKSLVRMFGPSGNPTVANVSNVLRELQRHSRVRLRVHAQRAVSARARARTKRAAAK
jgi:DNA-binding phage protein